MSKDVAVVVEGDAGYTDYLRAKNPGAIIRTGKKGEVPFRALEDNVSHPKHYTSHPSGIECITVTEHFSFNVGSAVKYLWRAGLKGDTLEDLKKARWYVDREIAKREGGQNVSKSST